MNKEDAIKYIQQIYPNGGHCWLDEQRIEAIGMAVKALQEEPVSDIDFEQELYKAFGQVKDFTLGMRIAKWFYDMGKKSREPVSEDLEEAADKYESEQQEKYKDKDNHDFDNYRDGFVDGLTHTYNAFKSGAQWQEKRLLPMIDKICGMCQKQQDFINSKDLGELISTLSRRYPEVSFAKLSRIAVRVAKWQKKHLWKPADGDDLPEIDREVIALLDNGKVAFAHRPNPDGWDAKSIITEKVERYIPKTYGKGGWNIPDVKYWLDVRLPKEIEL